CTSGPFDDDGYPLFFDYW
nr:immunoglobulin heavy chain junction region [Macaca mulatta]MOW75584.1 immunoglobulin heavy chain junction region [Macaca mulatta]MOW75692.1 immunoglobulin heavy chain junction region [Macaca mulatta]MOW76093.1 immunoglobulin heavy chain junction region [Macaca mulatta]MOW76745.1 immunoglobulin heavy chain junction region [Macaca mulatta]